MKTNLRAKWMGLGAMVFLAVLLPRTALAEVNINVNIDLPPLIEFPAPPEVVVLPGTDIYVTPDADVDIFFFGGWWWRPWHDRWYRSRHYDRGWEHYPRRPRFYADVPPGWRHSYEKHDWDGHPWKYERVPHHKMEKNWRGWQRDRHWEKNNNWGVQGYAPPPSKRAGKRAVDNSRKRRDARKGAWQKGQAGQSTGPAQNRPAPNTAPERWGGPQAPASQGPGPAHGNGQPSGKSGGKKGGKGQNPWQN